MTSDREGEVSSLSLCALDAQLAAVLCNEQAIAVRREVIASQGRQTYSVETTRCKFGIGVEFGGDGAASAFRLRYSVAVEEVLESSLHDEVGLLDRLPLALTVTDRAGTILHANAAARDLVGATPDADFVGSRIWNFVHPAGLDEAQESGWRVRSGRMASYERHLLFRRDGTSVPVETTTLGIVWKGEAAILVASHDLTGMETVERALEESQRLFSSVFHTAPFAISVSRNSDGTFVNVNPAFLMYLGLKREDVIGRSISELGISYDRNIIEAMRSEIMSGADESSVVEASIVNTKGVEIQFLCSATEIFVDGESCMLIMSVDITEHKAATRALRESEERFRLMADAAPVLIWISDRTGAFTFVNRQWLEFVGRPMEAEVGAGWTENVHPDDYDRSLSVYRSAVEHRRPFSMEYRLRRHDGEYRWVLDRASPRYESDGRFSGFIGSSIDITERRDGEERLREAKERAEEMTILKSAFLTNMTHEIRTPLTVILGFTSILRQGIRKEYQRFVTLIERSGRRLLLMLDSILDLAQLEAGTLEPEIDRYPIDEIVRGVAATLQPIAEDKGLRFSVVSSNGSAYAETDHAILSRVLNNLIDNAVKFTEEGEVRLRIENGSDRVDVYVQDTGVGIHDDFLPRIFDAFAQESTGLARTHQGSGLGLTVSRQLLELIGGSLRVESEKGTGSNITISIPHRIHR